MARVLFIEPFFSGSHKQLIDTLTDGIDFGISNGYVLFTLPGKKWHWRARTSALYFSDAIPRQHEFRTLFASSVLNLAELCALRPDLASLKKILYFHENQLIYPVRNVKERDFQYGYNQILSCIVADTVLFNSQFNMTSFLQSISKFFKLQPDYRPKDIREKIEFKCRVLYFPISMENISGIRERKFDEDAVLHIVWPHRWEHDKGPESFFAIIDNLIEKGCNLRLSVIGEQFSEVPNIFLDFRAKYENSTNCEILDWGFVSRERFVQILSCAHVVVSTALHEFFGVSMIEAALLGCYPLCPSRLSYPEIFPEECIYRTEAQLIKKLKYFCKNPRATKTVSVNLEKFKWLSLKTEYEEILLRGSEAE